MPTPAPDVLVISGPPGVGKTSVARCLAEVLPGTVVIDGDALRSFAPKDAREHLGAGPTYRAAAALAGAYLAMGARRVVFDYVFTTPRQVGYFVDALPAGVRPKLFTLWAPLDVVVSRESERPGRERVGEAVRACHAEIAANLERLGCVVDATSGEAKSVAATIHELAMGGAGAI